jgi:hypothetical protein
MNATDVEQSEIAQWDAQFTAKIKDDVYPIVKRYSGRR